MSKAVMISKDNEWHYLDTIIISEEMGNIILTGLDCEELLITTKGLKTDCTTNTIGVYGYIKGSVKDSPQFVVYKNNVFQSISTQIGTFICKHIFGETKAVLSSPTPDLFSAGSNLMPIRQSNVGNSSNLFFEIGRIREFKMTPSLSGYVFVAGTIDIYVK